MDTRHVAFAFGTSFWVYVNGKLHLIGTPTSKRPMVGPTSFFVNGQEVIIPKHMRIN